MAGVLEDAVCCADRDFGALFFASEADWFSDLRFCVVLDGFSCFGASFRFLSALAGEVGAFESSPFFDALPNILLDFEGWAFVVEGAFSFSFDDPELGPAESLVVVDLRLDGGLLMVGSFTTKLYPTAIASGLTTNGSITASSSTLARVNNGEQLMVKSINDKTSEI